MDEEHIIVWPTIADLMSGILLLVLVASQVDSAKGREDLKSSKDKITERDSQLEEMKKNAKKDAEERERLGVPRKVVERITAGLQENGIPYTSSGDGSFEIQAELLFALGKHELSRDGQDTAREIGQKMLSVLEGHYDSETTYADVIKNVMIIGHADMLGDDDFNLSLSQKRASNLQKLFLDSRIGLSRTSDKQDKPIGKTFLAAGAGSKRPRVGILRDPRCNNARGDRGCAADRRIEIQIMPKEKEDKAKKEPCQQ